MDVREAVASRYSCRAFRPDPVPEKIVREIIEAAARAPSAGNMQPWFVYALAGQRLEQLKAVIAMRESELPVGEGTDYQIYPSPMTEPYRSRRFQVGEMLYNSLGIVREDKPARYRQYARNFQFFDAPVGLFVARERSHGVAQWADVGGFLQSVMVIARAYGLDTCAQQAWVSFHKTIREFLNMPDHLMLFTGMSLGYADENAAINRWRAPRMNAADFLVTEGFPPNTLDAE